MELKRLGQVCDSEDHFHFENELEKVSDSATGGIRYLGTAFRY